MRAFESEPGWTSPVTLGELMACIDHTLIRPQLTRAEVAAGLEAGRRLGTATVVVRPWEVRWAHDAGGPAVRICTSIAFPHGVEKPATKVAQTIAALEDGADEVDVMMNVAAFLSGERDYALDELRSVVAAAGPHLVKVIIETGYLSPDEVLDAARLAVEAGAGYVKNGTGYSPRGASPSEIRAIRATVPGHVGVKAAGGIRSLDAALALIEAGASRIGTSATVAIAEEWRRRGLPD